MVRLDIKTGFLCNNNCRFCVQAGSKCKGNRSFEEIRENLIECRERCDEVVLTGGEVTIRKDFFDIVKLARDLGYKVIQVQTNGRMFSDMEFCKKSIATGVTHFAPALHGFCAEQHDYLTGADGSFRQTVLGILNLKKLGQSVSTNSVIVKSNYRDLPKIAALLVKLDVDQFQFAFVHALGNAWDNFDNIVPRYSLVEPYVKRGLQIGIDAGKRVMAEAVPCCFMKGYEDFVSERVIPDMEVRGASFQNTNDFTKQRKEKGKAKFVQCNGCKYDNVCEGPWRDYSDKFGSDEFKAVKDG